MEVMDSSSGQPALTEAEENWQRAASEKAARLKAEQRILELEEQLRKMREKP